MQVSFCNMEQPDAGNPLLLNLAFLPRLTRELEVRDKAILTTVLPGRTTHQGEESLLIAQPTLCLQELQGSTLSISREG